MAFLDLGDCRVYYEDRGQGKAILFLHGVWMSSAFFRNQLDYFGREFRAIAPDFRGHGRSSPIEHGHTVSTYASDLNRLIQRLRISHLTLVGWSMGALVMFEYFKQFGTDNVKAAVVIDQSASDYKWDDWSLGVTGFDDLKYVMTLLQTNRPQLVREFLPAMFKNVLDEKERYWMEGELVRPSASAAGAIFFDQTLQDYRASLSGINIPTLLCFGRDEKMMPVDAGRHLKEILRNSELVIFEESGHCPFLEEPDSFNLVMNKFIDSIR